jgi:hypothetical protein
MNFTRQDGMPVHILLIEDSSGDVWLTREFRVAGPSIELSVANDGADAMANLKSEGVHAASRRPALILPDL